MSSTFDAYYKWLGIPPDEQPPHHYRLLGLKLFEADADAIENAADQRMAHLRTCQIGSRAERAQQLLNDVAAAKVCLLDQTAKSAYDAQLGNKLDAPLGLVAIKEPHFEEVDDVNQPVDHGRDDERLTRPTAETGSTASSTASTHFPVSTQAVESSAAPVRNLQGLLIPGIVCGGVVLLVMLVAFSIFGRSGGDAPGVQTAKPASGKKPVNGDGSPASTGIAKAANVNPAAQSGSEPIKYADISPDHWKVATSGANNVTSDDVTLSFDGSALNVFSEATRGTAHVDYDHLLDGDLHITAMIRVLSAKVNSQLRRDQRHATNIWFQLGSSEQRTRTGNGVVYLTGQSNQAKVEILRKNETIHCLCDGHRVGGGRFGEAGRFGIHFAGAGSVMIEDLRIETGPGAAEEIEEPQRSLATGGGAGSAPATMFPPNSVPPGFGAMPGFGTPQGFGSPQGVSVPPGFGAPPGYSASVNPFRLPVIKAFEDWQVPDMGYPPQLKQLVGVDVKFSRDERGVRVACSDQVPNYLIQHKTPLSGDFEVMLKLLLPPIKSGVSGAFSVMVFPANAPGPTVRRSLPPPQHLEHECVVHIKRQGTLVMVNYEGNTSTRSGNISGPCSIRIEPTGDLHFWITDYKVGPRVNANVAKVTNANATKAEAAKEPKVPIVGEPLAEVKLPAPVDDVVVGGGGKYLLLRFTSLGSLGLFDIQARKITKFMSARGQPLLAAGAHKLVVIQPEAREISRYTLPEFEPELSVSLPDDASVPASISMGSASAGPLLTVSYESDRPQLRFRDLRSLQEVSLRLLSPEKMRWRGNATVSTSADGRVFAVASRPSRVMVVAGNDVETYENGSVRIAFPGPLGQTLFTNLAACNTQLRPLSSLSTPTIHPAVPASSGPFYVAVAAKATTKLIEPEGPVQLHLLSSSEPAAEFNDFLLPVSTTSFYSGGLPLNKRLFFHAPSGQIIALASTNDRLIIKKFDLKKVLAEAASDQLVVLSQPPPVARVGSTYRYQLDVYSKNPGVGYELTSGPDKMSVSADGLLTWEVPTDTKESVEHVIVTVKDSSAIDAFHTFPLNVVDETKVAAKPAPKSDDPATKKTAPAKVAKNEPTPKPTAKPAPAPTPQPPKTAVKKRVRFPAPYTDVCVGAHGRYLIFYLKTLKKFAVLDVALGKVIKFLDTGGDQALFAAGANDLVVAFPEQKVIQRVSFDSWEVERTAPLPESKPVASVAMGAGSQGPVLIAAGEGHHGSQVGFLKLRTLQPIHVPELAERGSRRFEAGERSNVRVSADGRVFTAWRIGLSPSGVFVLHLNQNRVQLYYAHETTGYVAPNSTGGRLYTGRGIYTNQAVLTGRDPGSAPKYLPLPAVEGEYVLHIGRPEKKPPATPSVSIHLEGRDGEIVTLSNIEIPTMDHNVRNGIGFDKRIHFVPSANVIVTLPESNDEAVLHNIDIVGELDRSGIDYLLVTSHPPAVAYRASELNYQIKANSKRGDVKIRLASGPEGMKVSTSGALTWSVPRNQPPGFFDVIVVVTDASKQELFHTFQLEVPESAAPRVAKNSDKNAAKNAAKKKNDAKTGTEEKDAAKDGTTSKTVDSEPSTTKKAAPATATTELRTWADSSGKFSVKAHFLTMKDGNVLLKTEAGKDVTVPLDRLSAADQAHVRTLTNPE